MAALRVRGPSAKIIQSKNNTLRNSSSLYKDFKLGSDLKKASRSIGMRSTLEKAQNESYQSIPRIRTTIPRVASLTGPLANQAVRKGGSKSVSKPGSVRLHSKLKTQPLEATFSK